MAACGTLIYDDDGLVVEWDVVRLVSKLTKFRVIALALGAPRGNSGLWALSPNAIAMIGRMDAVCVLEGGFWELKRMTCDAIFRVFATVYASQKAIWRMVFCRFVCN